jgi:hypothetical protein
VNDVDNATPWDTKLIAPMPVWNKTENLSKLLTVKLELQPMINLLI